MQANALVPELAVSDCAKSLDFYCRLLGFSRVYERPEEGFAYIALGQAQIMLDQMGPGRTFDNGYAPKDYPFGRGLNLQIEVDKIEPLLDALAAAGHPLFLPPEDKWYRRGSLESGNHQFVVADPDGYLLRFFQDLGVRPVG